MKAKKFLNFFWKKNARKPQRPDEKWILRHEKRTITKIRSVWRKQRNWMIDEIKKLSFLQENSFDFKKNTIDDEINKILSGLPGKTVLASEIVAFMRVALKRGGKRIVKDLDMQKKFGIGFDISNPAAQQFLEEKENWELSDNLGNIDGTTKKGLKKILVESHAEGKSYSETAKKIKDLSKAGIFSVARAKMIAVREIGVAYEEGNAEVMNDFRMKFPARRVLKKWQTVNDARVTRTHKQNQNMGWIEYNTVFDGTGDQHAPGSDNPRCRCFTKYNIPAKK